MGFGETTTSCSVKSWSLVVCPCSSVNFLSVVVYKLFMSWHLEFCVAVAYFLFLFFNKNVQVVVVVVFSKAKMSRFRWRG